MTETLTITAMCWIASLIIVFAIGRMSVRKHRYHNQLNRMEILLMSNETDLQTIIGVLNTVSTGVATLITQLNELRDNNPALADEIATIQGSVQGIADAINAALNPPPPV